MLRHELGAPERLKPWSGESLEFKGLAVTPRILEVLDLAAIAHMGGGVKAAEVCRLGAGAVREACAGLFTDTSQNPCRKCWTHAGINKCLTTSTELYCHARDRVCLPIEKLFFQGHDLNRLKLPAGVRQTVLHELAGEGICLPSLGLIIYALNA